MQQKLHEIKGSGFKSEIKGLMASYRLRLQATTAAVNRLDKNPYGLYLDIWIFATLSTYTARVGKAVVSFNFMVDYFCDGFLFQRERIYLLHTLLLCTHWWWCLGKKSCLLKQGF